MLHHHVPPGQDARFTLASGCLVPSSSLCVPPAEQHPLDAMRIVMRSDDDTIHLDNVRALSPPHRLLPFPSRPSSASIQGTDLSLVPLPHPVWHHARPLQHRQSATLSPGFNKKSQKDQDFDGHVAHPQRDPIQISSILGKMGMAINT